MDTLLKIEKKQRMLIEQISIIKILENCLDSFKEYEMTREELSEKLEALSETHLSIKKLDNFEIYINHIYTDWNKVRKTLLKTWIDLEEKRLDKIIETGSVTTITTTNNDNGSKLEKNYRNLLLGSDLKPKDYPLEVIYKHKITELPPFFKKIDEVNLTFDENSTYDEISILERIGRDSNLHVDNLYLAKQQHITNNFYFTDSRESLNKVFKDRADLTSEDLVRVQEIIRKQKRREMNIKFLYDYGFKLKKNKGSNDKDMIKTMKKDRSFKLTKPKKAIKKLQKTDINGQIRALLRQWVLLELKIINIRCEYFEEELLANRYEKVFSKILKKDIVKHNIRTIYKEATANQKVDPKFVFKEIDSEIFKSIPDFKLLDEGLGAEIDETASISSGSSGSITESLRNQTSYSHARDLNLFDRPKPKPKLKLLQRIESFCVIS